MPAIQQDCNVVVPMQKYKRLLVNNNKEGIHQFRKLGKDKELYPETRGTTTVRNTRIFA
jgi:hypothetical protein